jgi:hypothetical protein
LPAQSLSDPRVVGRSFALLQRLCFSLSLGLELPCHGLFSLTLLLCRALACALLQNVLSMSPSCLFLLTRDAGILFAAKCCIASFGFGL